MLPSDHEANGAAVRRRAAEREYIARNEPHPLAPYPPLLVNACLSGMIPTKEQTHLVPVTVEEIVEDAVKVYDAGARIVHVHARDEDEKPTWKAAVFESIITGIRRERPDVICCVTTSGRNWHEFERRSEVLQLTGKAKPEMASLTLGSLNFQTGVSLNEMGMIERLAGTMTEKGILPELEILDMGMVGFAKYLERKGLIGTRKYFNLILGSLGAIPATIANLAALVTALPENSVWGGAGIGVFQLPMNTAAIIAGGAVRVGIEDSLYYDFGKTQLASNEALVQRVVRIAEQFGRGVATPAQSREMLGLA